MRLFISVPLDADFAEKVAEVQHGLKDVCTGGRFPPQENLHITLAFVGEVTEYKDAKAALKTVSVEKTIIRTAGIGRFGKLYMLKIESDGALEALSASVRKALSAHGVPFDDMPFRAHITLVRDATTLARIPDVPQIKTEISSVCLMNSEQLRGKRIYTRLYTNTI